jgi:hypothetical protein
MSGVVCFPEYNPYRLLHRHIIGLTAVARTEVLDDTGGFDAGFPHYEDWELWVHALSHGHVGHRIPRVTLEYRRHAGSKFTGDRRRYRQAWRSLRRKHAALYGRRRELGRSSGLPPLERALYRGFWGPRPVPGSLEAAVHRRLWRAAD